MKENSLDQRLSTNSGQLNSIQIYTQTLRFMHKPKNYHN